jgi:hypothetical protein
MTRPLVPRNWTTTNLIVDAKKSVLVVRIKHRGKKIPAFNGSGTSKRNNKRPITLPGNVK